MKVVKLVPNHWLAALAAWYMRSPAVALVLGNRIYLHGTSIPQFLSQPRWVAHEMAHVQQYERHGIPVFLLKYGWYSLLHGYYRNPLEQEARAAELQPPPDGYQLLT